MWDKPVETSRQSSWPTSSGDEDAHGPDAIDVPVVISRGFHPAGFRMAAVRHLLSLSERPPAELTVLPRFTGTRQRFGRLALSDRLSIDLALDADLDAVVLNETVLAQEP